MENIYKGIIKGMKYKTNIIIGVSVLWPNLENIHKGIIIGMKYKTNMIIGVSVLWSTLGNLFHSGWCTNVYTPRLMSH